MRNTNSTLEVATIKNAKKKLNSSKNSSGAPSQLNQPSRKGKRQWRKNISVQDIDAGLEEMRAEERVLGTTLQQTKDSDLFKIDVKGDAHLHPEASRYSKFPLTSTKILAQRSAVPAVLSRPNVTTKRRLPVVSREEKERLLRISKRHRKGPFNSIIDTGEFGAGSAVIQLSEAVKASGSYDCWALELEPQEMKEGLEHLGKKIYKPPVFTHPKENIEVPAIGNPHQGTSYNPPVDAHQALLMEAYEKEQKRLTESEIFAELKLKMHIAKQEVEPSYPPGMSLDVANSDDQDDNSIESMDDVLKPKIKKHQQKTQSQRNKAAKHLAEKRLLAEKAARKHLLASISNVKMLRKLNTNLTIAREKALEQKRSEELERYKKEGLVGLRLGKHKVPQQAVEVQLGEDLSETLRELKPEGNLFSDRFLSLQQRALIEPRVPVLPKKRKNQIIMYEKHAWKRFE